MDAEPRQIKLPMSEGVLVKEKHKKEKESKANKWWLFLILVLTISISLFFYLMSGRQNKEKSFEFNLGKPKVYEF